MATPLALGALSLSPPKAYTPLRAKQDKPAYGVGGKGFFDDKSKFWYPGQALYWEKEPNLDLTPINKLAYEKMQAYLDKLDDLGEKAAKKQGRTYVKLAREEWNENGEQVELPAPEFVMGARQDGVNEAVR